VVGTSYYDFRGNTSDRNTLLTEYWLARSADTVTWQENQIAGPFDLALAPVTNAPGAGGYFLGDYQGLLSVGTLFQPLFVQTNAGNLTNRTDVFAAPAVSVATSISAVVAKQAAPSVSSTPAFKITPELQQRVSENIANAMEQRIPGWRNLRQANQDN
jgi:hypothetical protein